ncbi:hypothetical protein [Carnobacterium maltaromaticum]|uniref:hypothetical protein n=1 Tax=Carnobacterium maltaromaticum TaxID=2751 RepID=UPI00295EFE2B|nr:hypothetical protein [Carnobacterium maltaromaticum]
MTEKKHYYVNNEVIEVLESVKQNTPGITSQSQALRYIVLQYDNQIESKEDKKYNAISKEVSMMLEITANIAANVIPQEFSTIKLKPLTELSVYKEAKETVEGKMQANTTKKMRYKHKKSSVENSEIEEIKTVNIETLKKYDV